MDVPPRSATCDPSSNPTVEQSIEINQGTFYAATRDINHVITNNYFPPPPAPPPTENSLEIDQWNAVRIKKVAAAILNEYVDPGLWDHNQEAFDNRVGGTMDMFGCSADEVEKWRNTPGAVLCITGGPGVGKTFLVSSIFEDLRQQHEAASQETAVILVRPRCPAEIEDGRQIRMRDLVKALIALIFNCNRAERPLEPLLPLCAELEAALYQEPSLEALLALLQKAVNCFQGCFIMFDGLDRLMQETRNGLISHYKTHLCSANILLVSRPLHLTPLEAIIAPPRQYFFLDNIEADLKRFISHSISLAPAFSDLLDVSNRREEVSSKVEKDAKGMFYHAHYHLETLKGCSNPEKLLDDHEELQDHMKRLYEKTVQRIGRMWSSSDYRSSVAIPTLTWLAHAAYSMTAKDLLYAVENSTAERARVSQNSLLDVCSGLVVVDDKSGEVRFVHPSAQVALQKILASQTFDGWYPHEMISTVCMGRLRESGLQDSNLSLIKDFHQAYDEAPLLQYAHRAIAHHVQEALKVRRDFLPDVKKFVQGCNSFPYHERIFDTDAITSGRRRAHHLSSVHVAALFNQRELVIEELTIHGDVRSRCVDEEGLVVEEGYTCQMIAELEGHEELVAALCEYEKEIRQLRYNGLYLSLSVTSFGLIYARTRPTKFVK